MWVSIVLSISKEKMRKAFEVWTRIKRSRKSSSLYNQIQISTYNKTSQKALLRKTPVPKATRILNKNRAGRDWAGPSSPYRIHLLYYQWHNRWCPQSAKNRNKRPRHNREHDETGLRSLRANFRRPYEKSKSKLKLSSPKIIFRKWPNGAGLPIHWSVCGLNSIGRERVSILTTSASKELDPKPAVQKYELR